MTASGPERCTAVEGLRRIAAELRADRSGITVTRIFGSEALSVAGRMFAFAANSGDLVVKLPAPRIAHLELEHMQMRGRLMREWARVPPGDRDLWSALAAEALEYVRSAEPT
jgi:hypothetical protein